MLAGNREIVAYGERSHYVTSVRIRHPMGQSPDEFGKLFHVASPMQDLAWHHHAIVAPLYSDDPPGLHTGHRSQAAYSDDSRLGGSAADLHHG